MSRSKVIILFLFFFPFMSNCQDKSSGFNFSKDHFLIASNGDKESAEAADYFYRHLVKRRKKQNTVTFQRSDTQNNASTGNMIYFEVVPDLKYDYEIVNEKGKLSFFAKERATLRWLSYLLIDKLGHDHHLDVMDLPPNYMDFKSRKANFYMKYREPHLLPNLDDDYSGILLSHSIDRDWGLWGHNLKDVFSEGIPEKSLAEVRGKRMQEQFCFSSEETFQAISDFVIDAYGHGEKESKWFMISPNDNDLVCTCSLCRGHGNTDKNTTESVVFMLNKLALKFPGHYFFTTAYRTSIQAPRGKVKDNAGIFLSTINLPKNPKLDTGVSEIQDFSDHVKKWASKTNHIYLWDYISNFDDYITPFPVLERVKSQMEYFSKLGVEGVFLNGSGYDYSPFDDVKTYVLSAIMIDETLSVTALVKNYYQKFYPITGKLLASYLLDMEAAVLKKNIATDVYGPFRSASYFDSDKFISLYQNLLKCVPKLSGDEQFKIDKLLTALSYTQLQIAYHQKNRKNGFFEDEEIYRKRLSKYMDFEHLIKYKEEDGNLATYLVAWDDLMKTDFKLTAFVNPSVKGLASDKIYHDAPLLTDNLSGFTSDFNQGWFLTGEDIVIAGSANLTKEVSERISIRFLIDKKHRMAVPDQVEIFADAKKILVCRGSDFNIGAQVALLDKKFVIPKNTDLQFRIYRNKEIKKSVIACDEIQLY